MSKSVRPIVIRTLGDLEAVVLHELSSAFPAIINEDLYGVYGRAPHQNIAFHNSSCFDHFCIHLQEVFSMRFIRLEDGTVGDMSVFSATERILSKYQNNFHLDGLNRSYHILDNWLNVKVPFRFWGGQIGYHLHAVMSRRQMLWYAQILSKHNLFRVERLLEKFQKDFLKEEIKEYPTLDEVIELIPEFSGELKDNRLMYHSSYLVEMLWDFLASAKTFMDQKYRKSPTNDMDKMQYPDDISSFAYRGLYFSALYSSVGINWPYFNRLRPSTTEHLKAQF